MEKYRAVLNDAPLSAQKARLVAREINNLMADKAIALLKYGQQKAAGIMAKLLGSAVANAEQAGADIDELKVVEVYVNEGTTLKRMRARAKGRGNRISKRKSHITVVVAAVEE